MPATTPDKDIKNTSSPKRQDLYSDIELSEQQIKEGKTKDAKKALSELRTKYRI